MRMLRLSSASQVILFGHGPGCTAVMELITSRGKGLSNQKELFFYFRFPSWMATHVCIKLAQSVMQKVSSVVLVVGQEDIPQVPRDEDDLRKWYIRVGESIAASDTYF